MIQVIILVLSVNKSIFLISKINVLSVIQIVALAKTLKIIVHLAKPLVCLEINVWLLVILGFILRINFVNLVNLNVRNALVK